MDGALGRPGAALSSFSMQLPSPRSRAASPSSRPASPRAQTCCTKPVCHSRASQRPSLSRGRVVTAAARYSSAPVPASFSNASRSTNDNSILASIAARQAQWSDAGSGPGLPQTVLLHVSHLAEQAVEVAEKPVVTAVETAVGGAQAAQGAVTGFFSNLAAYIAALVARIQAAVMQLLAGFRRSEPIKLRSGAQAGAISAADGAGARSSSGISSSSTPVAFMAPASHGAVRVATSASASAQQQQQQPVMLLPERKSAFDQLGVAGPVLAVSAAAAALYAGCLLWQRWRVGVERQREVQQYAALQEPALARQKQRFQRALVVDSVNLELPAIKEMDIQPGPVQVEKIIQRQPGAGGAGGKPSSSAAAAAAAASKPPAMDTASLRQWQQFMASSRTTEVKDELRGSMQAGGRAGSAGRAASPAGAAAHHHNPNMSPHGALGDAELKDLSERIRRAGEGAAAEEAPVITFEQLYANSRESDEEAMARRAAERKARWQQQQQRAQQKQQPGSSGQAAAAAAGAVSGSSGRLGNATATRGSGTGTSGLGAPGPSSSPAAGAWQPQAPLQRSSAPAAAAGPAAASPPAKKASPQVAATASADELAASLAARSVRDSHLRPTAPAAAASTLGANNPFAVGLFGDTSSSPLSGASQSSPSSSSKAAPRSEPPQAGPRAKTTASITSAPAAAPAPASPAASTAASSTSSRVDSNTSAGPSSRPVNSRLEVSFGRGGERPASPFVQGPKEAVLTATAKAVPVAPVPATTPAAPAPAPTSQAAAPPPPAELSAALSQDLEEVVAAAAPPATSTGGTSSASSAPSSKTTSTATTITTTTTTNNNNNNNNGSTSTNAASTSGASSLPPAQPPPSRRTPEVGVLALALAGLAKEQLVTSLGSGSASSSRDEDDGEGGGSRRGRRAAAGGPLRTPDTQAPGLTRLMRRPTSSNNTNNSSSQQQQPVAAVPVKQDAAAML